MFGREEALHLIEYDRWANRRIAAVLAELARPMAEAERLWAHVVGTSELWFERVAGGDYLRVAVWPEGVALAELARRFEVVSAKWAERLARADANEFARRVEFRNSKGEACADPVEAIVRHLVNHGTHHRAQIASLMRASGRKPEDLDYIIWRRKLAREAAASTQAGTPRQARAAWRHFVIESTYVAPIERIDAHVAEHRKHLEEGFERGLLLVSGPQEPRTGGLILARARDRAELDQFLRDDPFEREHLWRTRVVEFRPVQQADAFAGWAMGE